MKTLIFKNHFLQLFLVLAFLLTNKVSAQQEEIYQKAIDLLQEQLNNPDLSKTDKESIEQVLKETKEIKNNLQSDTPVYDTSDTPVYKYEQQQPPAALPPKPTKEINNKDGKTLYSRMAN